MNPKNAPIIVAIAMPIVFIIAVAIFIYIPKANINPQHDFIYTTRDYSYYGSYKNDFTVVNGKVTLKPIQNLQDRKDVTDMPILYRYDISEDTTHQITFAEAQGLSLDPGPSSPDGYGVSYDYSHDGIFEIFGSSRDNRGVFITKGNAKKKLSLGTNDSYYSSSFRLIGWVK